MYSYRRIGIELLLVQIRPLLMVQILHLFWSSNVDNLKYEFKFLMQEFDFSIYCSPYCSLQMLKTYLLTPLVIFLVCTQGPIPRHL